MKIYEVKIEENGNKRWYLNGKLHREDGPAREYANGDKAWYLNGKLHREDGPAIEYANGDTEWYLNGYQYTEAELTASRNPRKALQEAWRSGGAQALKRRSRSTAG